MQRGVAMSVWRFAVKAIIIVTRPIVQTKRTGIYCRRCGSVLCKCLFGGKNVDLANENFMLSHLFPLMVTTTTGGSTPVTPTAAEHTGQ
uniref:Secreted protein n=1 Tax=Globodera pallida TaxID=36090 RepID=A0A183BTW5_GLOPA